MVTSAARRLNPQVGFGSTTGSVGGDALVLAVLLAGMALDGRFLTTLLTAAAFLTARFLATGVGVTRLVAER